MAQEQQAKQPELVLYDLGSEKYGKCWSVNVWKTRIALNYKGVPYTSKFLDFPEIQDTLGKLEIINPNTAPGDKTYTIPTVTFPDPKVSITDSAKIAEELERRYPDPPLYLDHEIVDRLAELRKTAFSSIGPDLVPKIAALLDGATLEWYVADRSGGKGVEVLEKDQAEHGGEKAWAPCEPFVKDIGRLLRENGEGPFFMGKTPSYADFVTVALLKMLKVIDQKDYDRFVKWDPAFDDLYKACGKWLERDD